MESSNALQISVYEPETLERIGLLSSWTSLVWRENYKTPGRFMLEVPFSEGILSLLKNDRYIGLTGRNPLMTIKTIQAKNNRMIINGFCLLRLLKDRVSTTVVKKSVNGEEAFRALFDAATPFPLLSLGESAGLEEKTKTEMSDMTLLDYAIKIAEEIDAGIRVRRDGKRLLFEMYRPNNAAANYSTLWGNIGDPQYTNSTEEYANVAIVAGEGEGSDRVMVEAGDTSATGLARREMYIDARGEQKKGGETAAAYKARLVKYGEEKLEEVRQIVNLSFSVNDDTVKLGEIVPARVPEYGVSATARIEAIQITAQRGKIKRELVIGTPILLSRRS